VAPSPGPPKAPTPLLRPGAVLATGGAYGSRAREPGPRRAEARPPDFDLARPTAGRPVTLGLGFAF